MLSTLKRKITISLIPPETLTLPLQFKKALYHVLLLLRKTHFFTNVSGDDDFLPLNRLFKNQSIFGYKVRAIE